MRLTGITPRQLQWWDEKKIVAPTRDGRNRSYGFEDLAELSVIAALRRKGFSLQRVRNVMRFLQRELGRRLADTVLAGGEHHLLTDGKTIYIEDSAHAVLDILKNSRQPVFGVCLTDEVQALRTLINQELGAASRRPLRHSAEPGRRQYSERQHPTLKNTRVRQIRAAS